VNRFITITLLLLIDSQCHSESDTQLDT